MIVDQVEFGVVLHEGELPVYVSHKYVRWQNTMQFCVQTLVNLIEEIFNTRQKVRRSTAFFPSKLLYHATVIRHAVALRRRSTCCMDESVREIFVLFILGYFETGWRAWWFSRACSFVTIIYVWSSALCRLQAQKVLLSRCKTCSNIKIRAEKREVWLFNLARNWNSCTDFNLHSAHNTKTL